MIFYSPTDSDAYTSPLECRPRTCFLMTQLGGEIPRIVSDIRNRLSTLLTTRRINLIDANSIVTGRDFLLKIWKLLLAVPVGIAIIHEEMSPQTLANIFYEIGYMQANGKEVLIIKTDPAKIPSDFVRTEYVVFDLDFDEKFSKFFDSIEELGRHFQFMAEQVEKNPILEIDYLRRAFLISGDVKLRDRAAEVIATASLDERSKNSVEILLAGF